MIKTISHKDKIEELNPKFPGLSNELILQNMNEGIAYLEALKDEKENVIDFKYLSVNPAFVKMFSQDYNNIINSKLSDVIPFYEEQLFESFKNVLETSKSKSFNYYSIGTYKFYKVSIYYNNKNTLISLITDITDTIHLELKNERLLRILRAIREIKEVILNEKNVDNLLNQTCKILVSTTSYYLVRITLLNQNQEVKKSYCSDQLNECSKHGLKMLPCLEHIIESENYEIYVNGSDLCRLCPLKDFTENNPHIVVPIVFENVLFGAITIVLNKEYILDNEENLLFKELAEDIAYALFNIDVQNDLACAKEKIKCFYQEIEEQNQKLRIANKKLEERNEKLIELNVRATESDRLKSVFLANMSHEIRTPLNGILGFSQLLTKANITPDLKIEYSNLIANCGEDLLYIVSNVLDISRMETNQLQIDYGDHNIHEIVENVFDQNKEYISHKKNVSLMIDENIFSQNNELWCDGKKLFTVLNILVKNAIKFTSKGEIKFGYSQKSNCVQFYVADTGIGIKKENFKVIFERFRQVDESKARTYGGAGLGLTIAKGFVELMNGKIWLESELNKGTTFYFKIPYKVKSVKENQMNEMDIDKIDEIDWSEKNILIVEDDIYSLEYLSEVLSGTQINIKSAKNGIDAIQLVQDNDDLDLVLMDIQLPGISGDKATKKIREFNDKVPIIAQTAHAMINDKENYLKAGCNDYISKPIGVSELFSVLNKYL